MTSVYERIKTNTYIVKRCFALLLVILIMSVAAGCGEKNTTEGSDNKNAASASSNEANASSDEAASHEYTAEALSLKSVKEIVEIMGGKFEYGRGKGVNEYTDGGCCIYNDDTLPGFVIYLTRAGMYEDTFVSQSFDALKSDIDKDLYDINFIGINDSAKLNDSISADMRYRDFIAAYGKADAIIIPGAGYPGHIIRDYNKGNIGNLFVFYEADDSLRPSGSEAISEELMNEKNPKIYGITAHPVVGD